MWKHNKKRIKEILRQELQHAYHIRGVNHREHKRRILNDINLMVRSMERELTTGVERHIFALHEVKKLKKQFDDLQETSDEKGKSN